MHPALRAVRKALRRLSSDAIVMKASMLPRVQIRGRGWLWSCWSPREFMCLTCLCYWRPTSPSMDLKRLPAKINGEPADELSWRLPHLGQYHWRLKYLCTVPIIFSCICSPFPTSLRFLIQQHLELLHTLQERVLRCQWQGIVGDVFMRLTSKEVTTQADDS